MLLGIIRSSLKGSRGLIHSFNLNSSPLGPVFSGYQIPLGIPFGK